MGQTSIESILSRAMEPPDKRTIDIGVKMLQSIGAVDRDENLTPLGESGQPVVVLLFTVPSSHALLLLTFIVSCFFPDQ